MNFELSMTNYPKRHYELQHTFQNSDSSFSHKPLLDIQQHAENQSDHQLIPNYII